MAITHTEVYRGFKGELSKHPLRWLPLFLSEFRVATRKKLPLFLLYGPVAIGTIATTVMVYLAYTLEGFMEGQAGPSDFTKQLAISAANQMAQQMLAVRVLIENFYNLMSVFCLLAATWFGSGLICEDRRVNAHLLYFSRPLTRLDYFFGKFAAVSAFGAFAMLVPGFLICAMAVLNSENYAFIAEEGDVIINSTLYALLWIGSVSSVVLAFSSLAPKKLFAMVGGFGFFMLTEMFVKILLDLGKLEFAEFLSLPRNFEVISAWMLAQPGTEFTASVQGAFIGTGVFVGLALFIVARRLKRMELSV